MAFRLVNLTAGPSDADAPGVRITEPTTLAALNAADHVAIQEAGYLLYVCSATRRPDRGRGPRGP